MLNMRKQDAKPVPPTEPASATRSIYDRYPPPRETRVADGTADATPAPAPAADDGPTDFVIGRGTRLKGEIEAVGDVIVEGKVEASIRAATMRIAAGGSVSGQVEIANAEIRGHFEGTLNVRECLTVSGEGHVSGTVRYGELKVERGARITGDIALFDERAGSKPPAAAIATNKADDAA